jgi:prephenate dehydrogenase
MRLAILGFGQIGGSVARALRERAAGDWSIAAWSPSGAGPRQAAREGVIAHAADSVEATIDGADLVLLAAPPLACLGLLDRLATLPGTSDLLVTDVASTKRVITARATERGLRFVGGHPMAGREHSGYPSADRDLFVGRPWVICSEDEEGSRAVERLAVAVGARPVHMDPREHDATVAAVSHLPLVLSAALVEAVGRDEDPHGLAAGGWASMTRLARGDPEMGAGILATNGDETAARIRAVRKALDEWLRLLDSQAPDAAALQQRLAAARAALEAGS